MKKTAKAIAIHTVLTGVFHGVMMLMAVAGVLLIRYGLYMMR